jgi:hypothetical protein
LSERRSVEDGRRDTIDEVVERRLAVECLGKSLISGVADVIDMSREGIAAEAVVGVGVASVDGLMVFAFARKERRWAAFEEEKPLKERREERDEVEDLY